MKSARDPQILSRMWRIGQHFGAFTLINVELTFVAPRFGSFPRTVDKFVHRLRFLGVQLLTKRKQSECESGVGHIL